MEKSPSLVYGARLELVYGLIAHRGFESLLLRQIEPILMNRLNFLLSGFCNHIRIEKRNLLSAASIYFDPKGGADMVFKGLGRVFSTKNSEQYDTIGFFWDEMSAVFGRENLQGLGYGWGPDSIRYVIGLKEGELPQDFPKSFGEYVSVELPDEGWIVYAGKTDDLDRLYDEIYQNGPLTFEIETFSNDGNCRVLINRTPL